jgi:hypothetical protein
MLLARDYEELTTEETPGYFAVTNSISDATPRHFPESDHRAISQTRGKVVLNI